MMKPLALLCLENRILGNQLVNRLEDLGYRVEVIPDAGQLLSQVRSAKPFVILSDLASRGAGLLGTIKNLRQDEATRHIPLLGITSNPDQQFHTEAVAAGATLVAMESGILAQLPQLLDMALAID